MIRNLKAIVLSSAFLLVVAFLLLQCKPSGDSESVVQRRANSQLLENYLRDNNINAVRVGSGLFYTVLIPSTSSDSISRFGDRAYVNYVGSILLNNQIFDDRFTNTVQEVIVGAGQTVQGLEQGLAGMRVGEKRKLFVPYFLGLGETVQRGSTGVNVPPYSALIYDVTLLNVKSEERLIDEYIVANNFTLIAQRLESGIRYIPGISGAGNTPFNNARITVKYVGKFLNGSVFDRSDNQPTGVLSFRLGSAETIPGFSEAARIMRVGEKSTFVLPSQLAYGARGRTAQTPNQVSILPYTPLVFEIELISFE